MQSEEIVRVYRAADPLRPTVYHRGEFPEAEPALADWIMPVDNLFPPRDQRPTRAI